MNHQRDPRPTAALPPPRMTRALLFLIFLAALPRLSSAELLANRGFESGDVSSWTQFGPDWRIGIGDDAHAGTYGAVNDVQPWHDPGLDWRGLHQEVPVTAGETYLASVFIRAVSVESSSSWLELQWLDELGGVIRQDATAPVDADQPFQLETLSWLAAPAGAVTASVRGVVFMPAPPAGDADFHTFDDFSLIHIPAGSLSNPGFETSDLTDWGIFGPGWRTGVGGDARSGAYGAVNDVYDSHDPGLDQWRGIFQNVDVSPATSYVASVYIRTLNIESSSSWLEIQWLNGEGGVIDQVQSAPVTNDQAFTRVQLPNLQPPAEAVQASLRAIVFMETPPAVDADFHIFDDLSFLPQLPLDVSSSGGGGIDLQWPADGVGYYLEATADLAQPAWTRVHQAPVLSTGTVWQISVPAAGLQSNYRLVKP